MHPCAIWLLWQHYGRARRKWVPSNGIQIAYISIYFDHTHIYMYNIIKPLLPLFEIPDLQNSFDGLLKLKDFAGTLLWQVFEELRPLLDFSNESLVMGDRPCSSALVAFQVAISIACSQATHFQRFFGLVVDKTHIDWSKLVLTFF